MKNIISKAFYLFAIISVSIFLCASIYMFIFFGEDSCLRVYDIWSILSIGIVSSIISIPLFLDLNLRKVLTLILQVVHFSIINLYTLLIGYLRHWFSVKNNKSIIAMEIIVIFIFIIAYVFLYIRDSAEAKKMNNLLNLSKKTEK